ANELGYTPMMSSELEFYLYKESYAEAWSKGYRDLTPTIPYILDYHVLATTMDEPFIQQLRRGMQGAGIPVEFSKGEAWYGQHELNVRYADAVTAADRHTIYKNGVKEIANLNGISASFMAKPSEKDIGSSCHIHMSLVERDSGNSAFVHGEAENATDPGPELTGNAYAAGEAEPFPSSLREAVGGWEGSDFAKRAFGEDVWRHYLNYGRTEQRLFDEVVTDYERVRMFERG